MRAPSSVGRLLALLPLVCTGCLSWFAPATQVPMPVLGQAELGRPLLGPAAADGLLVLLPGFGDRPQRFVEQGVFDLAREHLPRFDVVAADAHVGYYLERSLFDQLEAELVGPARRDGYRQVWLLGVSMGGLGATGYAARHRGRIDGVVLLAPYLGDDAVADSVLAAADLASWRADAVRVDDDDDEGQLVRDVWRWLQRQTGPDAGAAVFLGYGDDDGPGTVDEVLARALPPARFATAPGGHAWTVWIPLLRELLPRVAAAAREAAAG